MAGVKEASVVEQLRKCYVVARPGVPRLARGRGDVAHDALENVGLVILHVQDLVDFRQRQEFRLPFRTRPGQLVMPEINVGEHLHVARVHLDPCEAPPVPRLAAVLLEDVVD
eukprot:9495275-Pyramimonas_sp.AAC.1